MQDLVLKVDNLKVKLGKEEVLKDLSFDLKREDVLIILGPNGAGKTTLFRALLGLIPYTGSIVWQAKKINYLPPQELVQRKLALPITIREFFEFKKVGVGAINDILQEVGFSPSVLEKPFNSLSTGQFQRMMIAWALVDKPEVLLFDEATYGIDVGGEETIYTLLHRFWLKGGLTILLVTHDLNIVYQHANKVLCLNKEKICCGEPTEILTPQNLAKVYGTNIKFYKHSHDR